MKIFRVIPLVCLLASFPSMALSHDVDCESGEKFTSSVSTQVISILDKNSSNKAKVRSELTSLFKQLVNIEWMAKFVMGRNWRKIKDKQKDEYIGAYEEYLINSYVPKFEEYNGQIIDVTGSRELKKGEYLIDTVIKTEGEPDVEVTYRLRKNDTCYKIHDIVAEGVSLINTQRQDFGSVYNRKGFEGLVSQLKSKNSK